MSFLLQRTSHSELEVVMLQAFFCLATPMFIASAIVALAQNKPKLGVVAVIGFWCQIMVMLIFFEHPNLLTLVALSLFWGFCAAAFWKDALDTFLTGVVRIKRILKPCCGPRDFVVVSRKHLALYSTGPGSSPPLMTLTPLASRPIRVADLKKRTDAPFLERTQVCYKYLGEDYISLLDAEIGPAFIQSLPETIKSSPVKLCPPIQVVETDSDGDHDVTDLFKRFYLAHFPQTKTLYDFGLAMAASEERVVSIKLPRSRFRFTHSISDKTAEYSIDFADPSQSLILDVILRDLDQTGQEEEKVRLITEVKEEQQRRGLVEEKEDQIPKFLRLKTGRDKHFVGDKEKEEADRPSTPITETFEEDPHDIDEDLRIWGDRD
jgi:hypothetical protein